MPDRPNVLWLMADQHNAGSLGAAGHPLVRTPNLDRLAESGVRFTRAYCNNPICSPSRISFAAGQYVHTHGFIGNDNFEHPSRNPDTLAAVFRRNGWQTALIGKAHMIREWDREAYEHIRYCDLCDADRLNPLSNHYFRYLVELGLGDMYEDGALPPDHPVIRNRCGTAQLPYEHSIEHWTGEETLAFLERRDSARPFFLHMSFERPHPHWAPAAEYADMYDPRRIQLGPDAADWWEKRWAGRPEFIRRIVQNRFGRFSLDEVRTMLARHFALISVIDMEIGRVLTWLENHGELERTIIVYTADHGDFAGDHGICDKNLGIYESIHRIPFILTYPGAPRGETRDSIIEAIDLFPTLCELAGLSVPGSVEGRSILPEAEGRGPGKPFALCEWDFPAPQQRVNALRTPRWRLVYYSHQAGGELYDHQNDPYEMTNLWSAPQYREVRLALLEQLFDQVKRYRCRTDFEHDRREAARTRLAPTRLIHKECRKWSEFIRLQQGCRGGAPAPPAPEE